MSADRPFDQLVMQRIVSAVLDEPCAVAEVVQRVVDDEIDGRTRTKRKRVHRPLTKKQEATYKQARRSWVAAAKRLVPKMLRAGILVDEEGQLRAVPPHDEESYARIRIASVFGIDSDQQRVYDAAKTVLRTQPEIGVRAVINYMKMTRPRNKRALADAEVFEPLMWLALSGKLFEMWFVNADTKERVSTEDGMRMLSEDESGATAKLLVPMYGASEVTMHERRLWWLEEMRWKVHVDPGEVNFMAQGSRTRFVNGEERTRYSRAMGETAERAVERLAAKVVQPGSRALDYY